MPMISSLLLLAVLILLIDINDIIINIVVNINRVPITIISLVFILKFNNLKF